MFGIIRIAILSALLIALHVSPVAAQTVGAAPSSTATSDAFPAWAYPWVPEYQAPPSDSVPRRVADSPATFTTKDASNLFLSPDWHAADHPAMPEIVAHGRRPEVQACGSCHRAEGTGGPESASLGGLPAGYIIQQMADFKSGARKFSGPPRVPAVIMEKIARAATDAEVQAAAAYYSSLKPKSNIKVVETDTAPRAQIARVYNIKLKEGGVEPLGRRILEVPDDVAQFELRDSRAQFTAYAPPGSIARGEALAKSGLQVPCSKCHGPELKGAGPIPRIAGRSPSYIVRQLYDVQHGVRTGSASALMKPVIEKLTPDDMIAVAAYVASLKP